MTPQCALVKLPGEASLLVRLTKHQNISLWREAGFQSQAIPTLDAFRFAQFCGNPTMSMRIRPICAYMYTCIHTYIHQPEAVAPGALVHHYRAVHHSRCYRLDDSDNIVAAIEKLLLVRPTKFQAKSKGPSERRSQSGLRSTSSSGRGAVQVQSPSKGQ
jgi:hypothetical protein